MNPISKKLRILYSSRTGIRIAATTALLAYPLGCLSFLVLPNRFEIVGGGLLLLAFLSFACLLPTYIHRIGIVPQVLRFVDSSCRLDELEMDLRRRAQAFAYRVFSLLVLGGIMYLVIGADLAHDAEPGGIWMPRVDDHWLAILFGVLFYVLVLPLFYLAWKLPKPVIDDDPGGGIVNPEAEQPDVLMVTGMTIGLALGIVLFDNAFTWMAVGTGVGYVLDLVRRRVKAD